MADEPESARLAHERAGERRQATIVFADIAGYTQLCARSDGEQVQAMLDVFYDCVDGIVAAFGGHVVDHAGDGVLAVFGAPLAHGNDAERALRAAFDMHLQCARLRDPQASPISLHIGIASGEVVAAQVAGGVHRRYGVTGEAVNLAARLTGVATAGQTVLSDSTWRAVEHRVECSCLGTRKLKGLAEDAVVWLAVQVRDVPSAAFPFAGRRMELEQLDLLLAHVTATGSGRAVLVRGEPGIGKSRLVEEVCARARDLGFECHAGQTMDFGARGGQGVLSMLVRSLIGIAAAAAPADARAAVDALAQQVWFEQQDLPFLLHVLDLPIAPHQHSVLHAVELEARKLRMAQLPCRIALRRARSAPQVLVVEDVHWASDDLLAALALLARATSEGPVLLVMTSRIQNDPLGPSWKAAAGTALTTLDLGPLRDEEAFSLAGELVDRSQEFARQCVLRSEGNPLYLVQLLLNARSDGAFQLPGTIQSLVLARLDRLPPGDKLAIQVASVIGFHFSLDAVRVLCGDPDYACHAPLAAGLVRPQEWGWCFSHALIQEGVYASLLHARRRELHRMAAEHFRSVDPALCAAHLDRAEDPDAPAAYLDAARQRRAHYRADQALQLLDRALQLPLAPHDELELRIERGDLLPELGRAQDAMQDHERVLAIARSDAERARAWIGMAGGMRMSDRYDEALHLLDLAQAVAQAGGQALELARIHQLRGSLYFPLGRIDDSLLAQEQAYRFAVEAGSIEWQVRSLSGLADGYYGACRMQSARQTYQRCVTLSRAHGLGRNEVANQVMVGLCAHLFMEPVDEVIDLAGAALELARTVDQQRPAVVAHHVLSLVYLSMEDAVRARPHAQAAVDVAQAIGAHRFVPEGMLFVAKCLLLEGRRPDAVLLLREALALCRSAIDYLGPYVLGELAAATDDPHERDLCLAEGEQLLRKSQLPHNAAYFHAAAIELCLRLGAWDRVLHYAQGLLAAFAREPIPLTSFMARCGIACAQAGQGRHGASLLTELNVLSGLARQSRLAGYERRLSEALNRALSTG